MQMADTIYPKMTKTQNQKRLALTKDLLSTLIVLVACLAGCNKLSNSTTEGAILLPDKLDVTGAMPPLDMSLLQYDFPDGSVETHNQTLLSYKTDDWTVRLEAIDGSMAQMYHSNRMLKLEENGDAPADIVKDESKDLVIYRYHFPVEVTKTTLTGQYLINIGGYWLSGRVVPANPDQPYDQDSVTRFLSSLDLKSESTDE